MYFQVDVGISVKYSFVQSFICWFVRYGSILVLFISLWWSRFECSIIIDDLPFFTCNRFAHSHLFTGNSLLITDPNPSSIESSTLNAEPLAKWKALTNRNEICQIDTYTSLKPNIGFIKDFKQKNEHCFHINR